MSIPNLIFETFPVGPMMCNCSIIGDPKTRKSIVVDPGGDADKIISSFFEALAALKSLGFRFSP